MGHATANAKLHDQNYGEDAFDDNSDEDEENCQMIVSGMCLLQRRATEASTYPASSTQQSTKQHGSTYVVPWYPMPQTPYFYCLILGKQYMIPSTFTSAH